MRSLAIAFLLILTACSLHDPVRAPRVAPSGLGEELLEVELDFVARDIVQEWLDATSPPEPPSLPPAEPDLVGDIDEETLAAVSEEEGEWAPDPADFDLPIELNDRVLFWIDYFATRIPDRFALYLTRMGRYEPWIRQQLRERGMPQDLIYLALIESGFSPVAYSRAHAVGVWQFIAATGQRYGLEVSHYVDERRDPVRATEAALDYLQDLYDRFGSWYLAAAAYNCGENRVERILRERAGGARGDDALFWQIQAALPSETRDYVPKLIAATILGRYAEEFGFVGLEVEPPESFEIAMVPDATDLDVIAGAAGVGLAEIQRLNPHFLRGMTPPGREVAVRLPPGRSEPFAQAYALIPPDQRVRFIEHIIRSGETLSHIAQRYGVSVRDIQEANRIQNPHAIGIGRRLIVPRGSGTTRVAAAAPAPAQPQQPRAGTPAGTAASHHTVRAGDSLWTIARTFGVSVDDLRRWNNLSGSTIQPGQRLVIQQSFQLYAVQAGDTLWDIARKHGVTIAELVDWNNLTQNTVIRPGQNLRIFPAR